MEIRGSKSKIEQTATIARYEQEIAFHLPPRIKPRLIERYKEFWDDSILVIVVKEGNVFYAQRISELITTPEYYRIADFEKLQDIFTSVNEEDILHYKEIALQAMKTQKKSRIDEPEEEEQVPHPDFTS